MKDMINFPSFDFRVIAGHKGVNRVVRTVSVMDAPDIYNWLKGGEFLMTTGYIMKEDPLQIRELIIRIERAGAAALGIKLKRFIDELPKEVIDIANELDFPIVEIPMSFSFVDIINPVLSEVVNKQARTLLYSQKIHKSFTELVISGESIEKIVSTLSSILNRKVIYYDVYFDNIYCNGLDDEKVEKIRSKDLTEILSLYTCYCINIDMKKYGYIVIYDEEEDIGEYDKIALEHAATVLKLEIQKKISNLQIEARYRDEFVQDLIMNNVKSLQEIRSRSELYDWNFEVGSIVAIFDIDNFKGEYLNIKQKKHNRILEETRESIFTHVRKKLRQCFKNCVYTNFSDSIVFIINSSFKNIEAFKKELKKISDDIKEEVLKKYKFTITVGIGSYKDSPEDIHISYDEARKAIKLGRSIYSKNKTIFYEDLGIYKLFDNLSDTENIKEFYSSYIGKLIKYDRENNTQFLDTLRYLVKNDWNLKVTAKEIYIHYNTMKYRFNKITEILGMDLKESEDKLNIAIALKLLHMAK
ncbi:PucR family transcriptional regulator [Brassicibacter mesophilus]|uniref:PucR family transcriptional regulator n=1 Tax=Brassicibacter mesophilus TaxID=745119 RepID=UPI003D20E65A